MASIRPNKVRLLSLGAVAGAIAVWQISSMMLGEELLLPSPVTVAKRLYELAGKADFLKTVFFTFSRITLGFFIGFAAGTLLGFVSGRLPAVEHILWPYFSLIKSVPVASFIVLCLIWLSSENISVFISFLMVLPIIYTNTLNGIRNADRKLLEAADVFRVRAWRRFALVYLPALRPYLISGCAVAMGLSWKAGIAAEIIGIPDGSIGEKFYSAKIYFTTGDLFAWTAVVVVASVLFEKLFLFLLERLYRRFCRL